MWQSTTVTVIVNVILDERFLLPRQLYTVCRCRINNSLVASVTSNVTVSQRDICGNLPLIATSGTVVRS